MLSIEKLCRDFESCIGWPYASPGDNNENGIDCSGMFVRAYRLQGKKIYHGSNTIWRKHLNRKGRIERGTRLAPGMAVFKWKAEGDPQKDGLGNFYHIGLVTSADPLRIVHASSVGMRVKADTDASAWSHWGTLAAAAYPAASSQDAPSAAHPMLRFGSRGNETARLQLTLSDLGYTLKPDGIFGPMTREAVKTFQATHGLQADGIVGPLTWAALEAGV